MSILVQRLSGAGIQENIFELAKLRIEVFREYPYVYVGSVDYEVKYLKKYLDSDRAALIAAFDEIDGTKKIVGVASCLPLLDEADYVQKPFIDAGFDLSKIFYFGESVLQKKYRGQGIGKSFFDEREKWARSFNQYNVTTFCAVDRLSNHPLRPKDYKALDEFWISQGYAKNSNLKTEFEWQDLNESCESKKQMTFWIKNWT